MLLILSMMLRARNHRARQSRAAANKSWQLTAQRFAHARRGTHVAMAVNYAASPRRAAGLLRSARLRGASAASAPTCKAACRTATLKTSHVPRCTSRERWRRARIDAN